MAAKKCSKCGEEKPLEQFYKQPGCRDGLRPDCKDCVRSRVMRLHFKEHARHLARLREKWARNREAGIAANRAYYIKNRDKFIAAALTWAKANKEKVYSYQHNWRAASRAGGKHTAEEIRALYERQKGKCACCSTDLDKYHRDHIVPLSRGGTNDIANIQLLCPSCNTAKGAKSLEEFLKTRSLNKEDSNGRRRRYPPRMV
jgi:5-methylcytosine-specific restriction endonuclease McrA